MKAIRLTKAEVAYLRTRLCESAECPKERVSILKKLDAAEGPAVAGVAAGPIQEALVATSQGKVVPLVGNSGWARATKQATSVGATVEDARLIGAWMRRTAWLTGPKTVLDVLNQWSNWLTKASATAPPPSAPAGFGEDGRGASASQESGSRASTTETVEGTQPGARQGVRRSVSGFR